MLEFSLIQLKHLLFTFLIITLIQNVPVLVHEIRQSLLEDRIEHYLLQSRYDLVEFQLLRSTWHV
jgi:hypothetical protein